ncbi:RTA1-domain-containing protein [Mycena venus]|uniref:RTA1-domain-containing protein n=1 Tax=Mycena venus TaxID=2733690 RepID=A0A8H7CEL9_9AGAR|nr:RTA1-domain-containing protein [Mycena venus]
MVQVQCMDPRSNENYSFLYCPSFPAAVLFSVLFGLTTIAHFIQAIHYRKKFCWVIIMAGIWETSGLTLRVFSVLHTTSLTFGIPSQLLILLSPLWINAFLYVLMSRFVWFFLPDKRVGGIGARRLSLCFVLLDITAFLMQAVGGSMMSGDQANTIQLGIHIYMGGIGLQQFFKHLDASPEWKRPLYVMYASIGLITLRIVFRLIEFSSGFYSPITMHEAPFYTLEALPHVLVGPESEFPKKEGGGCCCCCGSRIRRIAKQETVGEKDLEVRDLLRTPSPAGSV